MTTKSRIALLSALAATPAFAAPFLAIGDNAELFLTARAEVRYEDNITFSPDGLEDEDVVLEFAPGAELLFGKNSLTTGSLVVSERFVAYTDHDEFNEELARVAFNSYYDGAKLKLRTEASYRELMQNSRDEQLDGRLVRRDVTTAGVSGEYAATEKSKLGLGLRYGKTDYKTAGFVDRDTWAVPANYYFAITPKVDLSAGIEYSETDVDAANADSERIFYNVGARGDFTPKLTGYFRVGYTTREDDFGNDSDMIGLDAGLTYAYSLKTQFTLDLSNDFDSSSGGRGQEIASVNVGIRSNFAVGFSGSLRVGYQNVEYIGSNREDDYLTASISVSYSVNRYLSLDAYYNYLDNSSDVAGAEFEANIIGIAANLRY
jgi:hypothetical protein